METKKLIRWVIVAIIAIVVIFALVEYTSVIDDLIAGFKDGYGADSWSDK